VDGVPVPTLLGRHADGIDAAAQADDIAAREGFLQVRFLAAYFRSGIDMARGELDLAAHHERVAAEFVDAAKPLQAALLAACAAWRGLYGQDWIEACAHGERSMQVARTLAAPSYRIHYGIPYVAGLLECGATDVARAVLDEQRRAIAGTALDCFVPLLLAVEARGSECAGDPVRARQLVADLWRRAAEREHGRYLSWLKPWMSRYADWGLQDGVEPGFIRTMIATYGWQPEPDCSAHWPWPVRIQPLGRFEVTVNGAPLQFGRKLPRRPLDLLRALVAHGGGVPEHTLADHLWPELEADAAHKSLGAALHRLRALLGQADAVILKGARLSLAPRRVWVDASAFGAAIESCRALTPGADEHLASARRARELYRGAFLADDRDDAWILSTRERLRGRFIQLVDATARALESGARHRDAADWYESGIEVDDLAEAFHHGLMRCLIELDCEPDAIRAYRRLQRVLSRAFGRSPSPSIEALYLSIASAV